VSTWEQVLTDLEARADMAEAALYNGTEIDPILLVPWSPPVDLGPLPTSLRERAIAINTRQVDVHDRLEIARAAVSKELAEIPRSQQRNSPFADTKTPSFVDQAV
jgi:hypothetical protein